jgi:integrase
MVRIMLAAELSGMRRTEVCKLLKSSVDLVGRRITLTVTKSGRVRRIPINDRLATLLTEAMTEAPKSPYVFLSSTGRPYAPDSLTGAFRRAAMKAGVEDARFHDLRHTFATRVRTAGAGIDAIATLLGHAEITTSARYAHVVEGVLRNAVSALDLRPVATAMPPASGAASENGRKAAG